MAKQSDREALIELLESPFSEAHSDGRTFSEMTADDIIAVGFRRTESLDSDAGPAGSRAQRDEAAIDRPAVAASEDTDSPSSPARHPEQQDQRCPLCLHHYGVDVPGPCECDCHMEAPGPQGGESALAVKSTEGETRDHAHDDWPTQGNWIGVHE